MNFDEVALLVRDKLESWNMDSVQVWTMMFESLSLNQGETAEVLEEVLAKCSQQKVS